MHVSSHEIHQHKYPSALMTREGMFMFAQSFKYPPKLLQKWYWMGCVRFFLALITVKHTYVSTYYEHMLLKSIRNAATCYYYNDITVK